MALVRSGLPSSLPCPVAHSRHTLHPLATAIAWGYLESCSPASGTALPRLSLSYLPLLCPTYPAWPGSAASHLALPSWDSEALGAQGFHHSVP